MQDLLTPTDPDWAAFNNGDPEYALRVAGDTIREYCGWHIAPSMTFTLDKLAIGTDGRIMLPSLYVTDVAELLIQTSPQKPWELQDPTMYTWFKEGYVLPIGQTFYGSQWYAGYYYEPGPYFLPTTNTGIASVTFTSGHDSTPDTIKQIAYEMANTSGISASGGTPGGLPSSSAVKEVASPGFRLVLGGGGTSGNGLGGTGTLGSLTDNQKNRLASYRIGAVK